MQTTSKSGSGCLHRCPDCNSSDISASNWEGQSNSASCDVTCEKCECTWFEIYQSMTWEKY